MMGNSHIKLRSHIYLMDGAKGKALSALAKRASIIF
jgi:hypothetical protein